MTEGLLTVALVVSVAAALAFGTRAIQRFSTKHVATGIVASLAALAMLFAALIVYVWLFAHH